MLVTVLTLISVTPVSLLPFHLFPPLLFHFTSHYTPMNAHIHAHKQKHTHRHQGLVKLHKAGALKRGVSTAGPPALTVPPRLCKQLQLHNVQKRYTIFMMPDYIDSSFASKYRLLQCGLLQQICRRSVCIIIDSTNRIGQIKKKFSIMLKTWWVDIPGK